MKIRDAEKHRRSTLYGITHTYDGISKIEFNDIISNEYTVVAAECMESLCIDHSHGIHIFVEVESATDFQTYDDLATHLRSNMHKKHGVVVPEIIFMEENTLSTYNCKNCSLSAVHKFHIYDDYFSKKLGDKVLYVSRALEESYTDILTPDTIDCNDLIYCEHSFRGIAGYIDRPLNSRQFDLLKEWYVEVPLEFQIILGSLVINKERLRRSDEGDSYLYSKIGRVYVLLDSGLNILNRNYNEKHPCLNSAICRFNYPTNLCYQS
ncbi:unnamed protein product [Mytilus coruscus]|uniref:Uncharacterized protein n=1 Tax=Mytilus coruscus TaxID=42192 RepID=A0A6J8C4Q3_MYTCO|nr:unnamed protein product [Mytilus coruscus]